MRNPRKHWRPKSKRPSTVLEFVKAAPALGLGLAVTAATGFYAAGDLVGLVSASGCVIKGNISINTGERIYHVPGQEYYAKTKISPQHGERWFCTEEEARAAGWRRART